VFNTWDELANSKWVDDVIVLALVNIAPPSIPCIKLKWHLGWTYNLIPALKNSKKEYKQYEEEMPFV
jgi:hypothetical protein